MKKMFLLIISLFLLTSCAPAPAKKADDGKITVYASFYAMYDFARTIGGDCVHLYNMTPSGDAHDYEPTAADMAKLTEADMFIYSGNGMEAWAEDVAETLPDTVKVVNASERLTNLDGSDPHVWLNIDNAKTQMQTICDALIETDPDFADAYARNMRLYSVKLDELKESYENYNLAGITLAVTHGAYGYLCEEFGMTQLALEGVAGDSDPSPAQMAEFVDEVKARNVKCIYYDPIEGGKLAEKAAKEAGVLAEKFYTFEYDEQDRDYVTVMMGNLLGNEMICL